MALYTEFKLVSDNHYDVNIRVIAQTEGKALEIAQGSDTVWVNLKDVADLRFAIDKLMDDLAQMAEDNG